MTGIIERCREIARFTEEPGRITRTFLSPPMRQVHALISQWLERAGCSVTIDNAGNLRGHYAGQRADAPRLLIGSHLDTVPDAGAFDGILGMVLGVALVERLHGRKLPFAIEVIGFAEEEGVGGVPFVGSNALVSGTDFDPSDLSYIEFHIEQGPVLDELNLPLGIVTAIAGQSRYTVEFQGKANHAGTTPMHLRRDAVTCAAEWILDVEEHADLMAGLVATVGQIQAEPGAANVIAGSVRASLDVRHANDEIRRSSVREILRAAEGIAVRRGLSAKAELRLDQGAVPMDEQLTGLLEQAVRDAGYPVQRMVSGAGHDAMIMAQRVPSALLFVRSPGGISHHPDETVYAGDVEAALAAGERLLQILESHYA